MTKKGKGEEGGIFNFDLFSSRGALQVKALCLYAHTYLDIRTHIDMMLFKK